ncbi:hypothetical protein [uncultured Methanobrevibacter sp.]|uniref:hypothetical protein n=1 Tax=uncultured Methanobrevibacter sp. TaxID=253161 RepID=UPI0026006342|nr:hypothetical protein [uncultured Methanobrevibacter sp.]
MNTELIKIFGVTVNEPSEMLSFEKVNREAVKKGYIVHPYACTKSVLNFVKALNVDYNSTFYKTFEEVASKSRLELFFDQVLHYASTYGTDYQGEAYVPNENYKDTNEFVFDKYKVIMSVSVEEMCNKCLELLYSGIALKQCTIDACVDFVYDSVQKGEFGLKNIDIDKIKNREALVVMCKKFGLYPTNAIPLFRYIVYAATNETLLIKNRALIDKIKTFRKNVDFTKFNDKQITQLSTIFFRYKPLFLAFKDHVNGPVINKIRRLAEKNHKPLSAGLLETIVTNTMIAKYAKGEKVDMDKFNAEIEKCTNFKIIRLLQSVIEKTSVLMECFQDSIGKANGTVNSKNMYVIRNGKVFFKGAYTQYSYSDIENIVCVLNDIYNALRAKLVSNLKANIAEGTVASYIPIEGLHIAAPISEKTFVGDYPNGSYYDMKDDNIFGIFWKEDWGTRDFDLSFQDVNGNRISWNASYSNDGFVYSGDMTSARPHATECIKFGKDAKNGVFCINRYNGTQGSLFEIFMSQSKNFCEYNRRSRTNGERLPYMVDPNTIVFKTQCVSDKTQKMLAVICDGKVYLSNLNMGNSIVANYKYATAKDIYNIYVLKSKSTVMLYELLEEAGYKKVDETTKDENTIDFRTATKADIIALLS